MKLSGKYPKLKRQREQMRAPRSSWEPTVDELDPRRQQVLEDLQEGKKEVGLSQVENLGGLLTYQGEQITLHIKDTGHSAEVLRDRPEDSRRFHIAECSTLAEMRQAGRFERYVVSNRKDGYFVVDWREESGRMGEMEAALKVCKNCLQTLNYQGYRWGIIRRGRIWRAFDLKGFFMEYATFFQSRPSRRETEAEVNRYVRNWPEIARKEKDKAGWHCQACGVCLEQEPRWLHCHHVNGVVTDNSDENLKVLCWLCHSKQPAHQHIKPPLEVLVAIKRYRREQGLPDPEDED